MVCQLSRSRRREVITCKNMSREEAGALIVTVNIDTSGTIVIICGGDTSVECRVNHTSVMHPSISGVSCGKFRANSETFMSQCQLTELTFSSINLTSTTPNSTSQVCESVIFQTLALH
ncbi:hypothetical protein J6590_031958 [Homalodisca vitripennis]|nr:hypothetical protein J6590_031958 [Homalodisca vitripennis]